MKMMLIDLKRFILSLTIIISATIVLILISIKLQVLEALALDFDSQNILFWGIVAILVQLLIGLSLLVKHRKVINDLRRISSIGDISQNHSVKILKNMGVFGHEVKKLVSEQNDLAVMRSNRISALNLLNIRLIEDNKNSILVTDTSGSILGISNILKEKVKKEKGEIIGENVILLMPELNFTEIMNILESSKTTWKDAESSGIKCDPIFDKTGIIQFCLWEFENNSIVKKLQENQTEQIKSKNRFKASDVFRFLPTNKKNK